MERVFTFVLVAVVAVAALLESSGFHCRNGADLRLDRRLHGKPQSSPPPFEMTVLDENGLSSKEYEPGKNYRVRIVGYVHFRGILLQPRLASPDGHLLGSLRGGRFIEEDAWSALGIGFQSCGTATNDSITHMNDDKKFLAETIWTTDRDVGAVQFMATLASDDDLYWERWRPSTAFIRPHRFSKMPIETKLFPKEPINNETLDLSSAEALAGLPFEVQDISMFATTSETPAEANPDASSEEGSELEALSMAAIPTANKRLFNKFPQEGLAEEDRKFLSSHVQLSHRDQVIDSSSEEGCLQKLPCENGGHCRIRDGTALCECPTGFRGEYCEIPDVNYCLENSCSPDSICENNQKAKNYTCKCNAGFVGTYCQFACPPNQCENGGECILRTTGQLGCRCTPGWTGARCHKEVNECNYGKCKNGASCTDLHNDYKCHCTEGWMGKNCDRPCRDVYGSCRVWKREGQCELMRAATDFFEQNCAAACGRCVMVESIASSMTSLPLPPILLPLAWMLGEWRTHVKGYRNKTMDYPIDMTNSMSYTEVLTFSVTHPMMFGTPSINYTCSAVSDDDATNVHTSHGFLTIRQYPPIDDKALKASLVSVTNHGQILIEEGDVSISSKGNQLQLLPTYIKSLNSEDEPSKMSRNYLQRGDRMQQSFTKEHKGRTIKYSKSYVRTKKFDYL